MGGCVCARGLVVDGTGHAHEGRRNYEKLL